MTLRLWNAFIHLARTQTLGLVALVISLGTGTAYAASVVAPDSVVSASIVNGEVKKPDLGTASVTSGKVEDNTLWGADVHDESLLGDDVVESSLGLVPAAAQGGTGRWAFDGHCDPTSTAYVACSYLTISPTRPGRLLINGVVLAVPEFGQEEGNGFCQISVDGVAVPQTNMTISTEEVEVLPLLMVTDVVPAGPHQALVSCSQTFGGAVQYPKVRVTAVVLSDQ